MVNRDLAETDPRAWALKALEEIAILKAAHERHAAVLDVFSADLNIYRELAETDERPFWGRTIVRSLFAGIEGLCYCNKQIALAAAALKNIDLTSAEVAMLREESYRLNDKGEVESIKSKLGTVPNLAFSLRMLARARGGSYQIDTTSAGWQAFKTSIRVRDRITHPKDASDLQVTKEEVGSTMNGASWFLDTERGIILATPIPATPVAFAPSKSASALSSSTGSEGSA
jgi:hypothetical protein